MVFVLLLSFIGRRYIPLVVRSFVMGRDWITVELRHLLQPSAISLVVEK